MLGLRLEEGEVSTGLGHGVVLRVLADRTLYGEGAARLAVDADRQRLGPLIEAHPRDEPRLRDTQTSFEQPVIHVNRPSIPAGIRRQGFAAPGCARP